MFSVSESCFFGLELDILPVISDVFLHTDAGVFGIREFLKAESIDVHTSVVFEVFFDRFGVDIL